jgi:hypothetical protein
MRVGDARGDDERLAWPEPDDVLAGEDRHASLEDAHCFVGTVRVERRHEARRGPRFDSRKAAVLRSRGCRLSEYGLGSHEGSLADPFPRSQAPPHVSRCG